mgnify:CR=1 FL=1
MSWQFQTIEKAATDFDFNSPEASYAVFLCSSRVPYPAAFARHYWFVVKSPEGINRWEFGKFYGSPHPGNIGVLRNFFTPGQGMNKFGCWSKARFSGSVHQSVSGAQNSQAQQLLRFIVKHAEDYPFRFYYRYRGPNSNSFISWVLSHFPDQPFSLRASAIGQHYPVPLLPKDFL